jgi:hypothetical protein
VRRVLTSHGHEAVTSDEVLGIIQRFDEMVVEGAVLGDLTAVAAELMQADVFALDALNDRATPGAEIGHELLRTLSERPRTREVLRLELDGATVHAAALEHGPGRLGLVWTTKAHDRTETDELVLERFAQAASIAIQQEYRRATTWSAASAPKLAGLVTGELDEQGRADAVRAANLNGQLRYAIVALSLDPPGAASDAVAIAAVGRALDGERAAWRPVTGLNAPMLIATSDAANARVLAAAVADAARSGWRLHIGVGEPMAPEHLDRSAAGAREALAYGVSGGADGVTLSADLGAIQLLARIPPGDVQRNADVAAIANLADAGAGVSDLTLLMTYCETGTMRKTGERLALHHSSVEYRLRRIEELLGFSVSTPGGRFRAQVGIMVVRMMRTGDIV